MIKMKNRKKAKEQYYKNVEEGNRMEEIEKKVREEFEELDGVILDENEKSYYR